MSRGEDEPAQADRRRITRKAAAFDLFLDNLPTAAHPNKGDPARLARALEVLNERDQDEPELGHEIDRSGCAAIPENALSPHQE